MNIASISSGERVANRYCYQRFPVAARRWMKMKYHELLMRMQRFIARCIAGSIWGMNLRSWVLDFCIHYPILELMKGKLALFVNATGWISVLPLCTANNSQISFPSHQRQQRHQYHHQIMQYDKRRWQKWQHNPCYIASLCSAFFQQ